MVRWQRPVWPKVMRMRLFFSRRQLSLAVLALVLLGASGSVAVPSDATLHQLREGRRQAARRHNLAAAKNDTPGRFGLLVIPVDFADARLPSDWDNQALLQRLNPDDGETLHNYFRVASQGRLDLSITVAQAVHLPDPRRLYSDRDLNGFTRTRRLATEAITAARAQGLEFRTLDNDGPDAVAGTDDDDGQVDGVLILHAGAGTENDPDGLIQALQFYLAEPVMSGGVAASFYAVASLHSGPGIWAHETGHLLGLEDRYDPLLPVDGDSELQSVGGLGRFSLMSSGAWGTGGGYGAALPDAYSSLQMGWVAAHNLTGTGSATTTLVPGTAARVWTQGRIGPEFFLLETRSPTVSAPFDANVPGGQLLVYHIDETLAEGAWHTDAPQVWHLRARLVEADNDRGLATGQDHGSLADLFPGTGDVTDFGPLTTPPSTGYYEGPSRISLRDIEADSGRIRFRVGIDTQPSVDFSFGFDRDTSPAPLNLTVRETGDSLPGLTCRLTAVSVDEAGYFADTGTRTTTFTLVAQGDGRWVPALPVGWVPDPAQSPDTSTRFAFEFFSGPDHFGGDTREWVWLSTGQDLDFHRQWPGKWVVEYPDGNTDTTWHRWTTAPWLTADRTAVLACTSAADSTSLRWPEVTYGNGAWTTLTSAPLGAEIVGVRLVHAIETEMLDSTIGLDGGVITWVGPDGAALPAAPLDGYPGRIASRSGAALHGQPAFVAAALALSGSVVQWRSDVFATPTDEPGPWRLRLSFAANSLWRARGWYVADIEPILTGEPASGFTPTWSGDLAWTWPWADSGPLPFVLQSRTGAAAPWLEMLQVESSPQADGRYHLDGGRVLAGLVGSALNRHEVRIIGVRPLGQVAGMPFVIYPDGGDGWSEVFPAPRPNPAVGEVRFRLDIPAGHQATLRVFDLAGRLLTTKQYGPGSQLARWDGLAGDGSRVPAGVYFLRLEGTGSTITHKVVLLH